MIRLQYLPQVTTEPISGMKTLGPVPSEVSLPVSKNFVMLRNGIGDYPIHDGMVLKYANPTLYHIISYPKRNDFTKAEYDEWKLKNMPIIFASDFRAAMGFGYQAIQYALGMAKHCDLYVMDRSINNFDWPDEMKDLLKKQVSEMPLVTLYDLTPTLPSDAFMSKYKGIYTMFETDKLAKENVDIINSYDFCITPSEFSRQTFINSGVYVPIYVVPHGVDSDSFSYVRRKKTDPFVFGMYGQLTPRKGADIAFEAFQKAFPKSEYPNVIMTIKTTMSQKNWGMDDRILTVPNVLKRESLVKLIQSWNAFVFPTRGEGFGLPPIEAMATGCPVICTGFSGVTEYLNEKTGYPIPYHLTKSWGYETYAGQDYGNFGEPSVEDTAKLMRYVYENYNEAIKKADYAAKYVRKNFQWDNMSQKMIHCIDEFLQSKLPEK